MWWIPSIGRIASAGRLRRSPRRARGRERYRDRPIVSGAFADQWRLRIAAAVGVLVLAGLVASDFQTSFWDRHALTSSILSSLVVVLITVVVINEALERRNSARWRVF